MFLPKLARFYVGAAAAGIALWIAGMVPSSVAAQEPVIDIKVDKIIRWDGPFPMDGEDIGKYFNSFLSGSITSLVPYGSEFLYRVGLSPKETRAKITFLDRFKVASFRAMASSEMTVYKFELILVPEGDPQQFRDSVEEVLGQVVGCEQQSAGRLRMPNGDLFPIHRWPTSVVQVTTCEEADKRLWVEILNPAHYGKGRFRNATVAARETVSSNYVETDLDPLLAFEEVWGWTVEDLEKKYRVKKEEAMEAPPQFEWLDAGKNRARFSRKLYSNIETKLSLFGKTLNLEEAVIEFVGGKAGRVTFSLYNRGDSGEIQPKKFHEKFVTAGKTLGQKMKVAPKNMSAAVSGGNKIVSWLWQSPAGLAMLEHNDYSQPGQGPEFLRLKLAAPNQADWSMGKLAVGVQRMALQKNITKTAEGDVFISGVPMVDQGSKGYCVAASCQRLFEYMQIPCDQHEIAQLVNVDAESGANILGMQKSLAKIDGKYQVAFKPHINPEQYYRGYQTRRVSQRQFALIIKEHADKGIPLLWALQLGHPENPPLPNEGQVSGGHMRLVIGYNTNKGEVIFTDSWGAGHEVKRMKETDAYDATLGLYSMSPRGL